jgi:hypothetical protein
MLSEIVVSSRNSDRKVAVDIVMARMTARIVVVASGWEFDSR